MRFIVLSYSQNHLTFGSVCQVHNHLNSLNRFKILGVYRGEGVPPVVRSQWSLSEKRRMLGSGYYNDGEAKSRSFDCALRLRRIAPLRMTTRVALLRAD